MGECIIPFKSVTYAESARRLGAGHGIYSERVSVDPNITKLGCSVGLRLRRDDYERLISILDGRKIPHGNVIGG